MTRRRATGVLACSAGLAFSCGGRTTASHAPDLDASSSTWVDSASLPGDATTSGTPGSVPPPGAVGRDAAAGAGSDMTRAAQDSGAASGPADGGAATGSDTGSSGDASPAGDTGSTGDTGLGDTGSGGDTDSGGDTACGASFEASFGHPCSGPVLPSSEHARVKARYVKDCQNSLTFPGAGAATEMQLSACTAVTLATDCKQTPNPLAVPECVFRGTLPTGSACNFGAQCQSTRCTAPPGSAFCGTCAPPVADGQTCATSLDCQPGSACDNTRDAAACEPVVQESAGASCGGTTADCAPGLYCDMTAGSCAAYATEGASCHQQDGCGPALTCVGGICQTLGDAGATCQVDSDCNVGFGCSDASQTCGPVTWVGSGQPCVDLTRCLVGQCSAAGPASPGNCPTVVADGQPCDVTDATTTCDQFADCLTGLCVPQDSFVCR